jgi:uncharacterized alpha-E superfamily protein
MTAFAGVMMENMTRGRGWLFLDIGRRIERAIQTAVLMHSLLVKAVDEDEQSPLMEAILSIVDSSITYRRRYRAGMQAADVLELVLADERNPRSVAFQVTRIDEHINGLPGLQPGGLRNDLQRLSLEIATMLRLADVRRLAEISTESGEREALAALLVTLEQRLPALSDMMTAMFFRSAETPHQLLRMRPRIEQ